MPTGQISNQVGAFGLATTTDDTSGVYITPVNGITNVTINAGDLVALSSVSGKVVRCLTNTSPNLIIGVAATSILPSATGVVIISGPAFNVSKDTAAAVTAGDNVTRSAAVTASVLSAQTTAITQLKDVGQSIGTVMANATAAATVCDIFVNKA